MGVETYGGGIWHSWLDRDLSLAGRIIVAEPGSTNFHSKLVKIDRPLLRIPTLAIHLDRNVNDALKFNQESEFIPILGLLSSQLNGGSESKEDKDDTPKDGLDASANHHAPMLQLLADELSIKPETINDFELHLYDTQPATLGGIAEEFVFAPRLDNQMTSSAPSLLLLHWTLD